MKWTELISEISEIHDFSIYFPNFNFQALQRELVFSNIAITAEKYLSFCLFSSATAAIFSVLILMILRVPFLVSSSLPPIFFVFIFTILIKLPAYLKKKRAERIEREYSFAIREIIVELRMDVPFERILENVAKGGYGELSLEYAKAQREIKAGVCNVPEALMNICQRVGSSLVLRISSQLIFSYENGLSGGGLAKLASEMIVLQKAKVREFSSKMAFFGLLFIAISCIVPALFAAYIIIGSFFLSLSITNQDILIAYLVVFPLLSLLALLFIREKSPKILTY